MSAADGTNANEEVTVVGRAEDPQENKELSIVPVTENAPQDKKEKAEEVNKNKAANAEKTNTPQNNNKPRISDHDENGFRVISEETRKAPTFKHVCLVSLCPGCGACCSDLSEHTKKVERTKIDSLTWGLDKKLSEHIEQAKKLKRYFDDAKQHPSNGIECATPVQMKMMDKEKGPQDVPLKKNPDAMVSLISFVCCWRCGVAAGFVMLSLPLLLLAKYGLGLFVAGTVCFCLAVTLFAMLLRACKPKWFGFELHTPSMRDIFLNVVDMKVKDKAEMEKAGKNGMKAKVVFVLGLGCKYLLSMLRGFCCCQFFHPRIIFTFAKTLIAMIFTEIAMVISANIYAIGRFACGTMTWTSCSLLAWTREFMNDVALRDRVLLFKYPAWSQLSPESDEDTFEAPAKECECCDGCVDCICNLPCCTMCDCKLCCDIMCPLCCSLFSVWLDGVAEAFSTLLLVGKALIYTRRIVPEKPNAAADQV